MVIRYKPHNGKEQGGYLPRYIDTELNDLESVPAIAVEGAKGVGKSITCERRADITFQLDDTDRRELFASRMKLIMEEEYSICIDEWQYFPEVWNAVRRKVDARCETKFFLTGSATPITGVDTHSGAGRINLLHMRPFALSERATTRPVVFIEDIFNGKAVETGETDWGIPEYADAICETGFCGINRLGERARRQAIESYIQRAIDRDIPEQGLSVRKPRSLRAWWSAYAAASSTTTMYNKILDAATGGDVAKISKDAALGYRDALTKLWLLEPVEAWYPNFVALKKLTTGPKHQVVDPGIAAALLGLTSAKLQRVEPGAWAFFGQLFESLATLTVRSAGQAAEAKTYHLRTQGGEHEVDLILERYDGAVIAFEVKAKPVPNDEDVRHLHWLGEQIGDKLVDKVVITIGEHVYRRQDGVLVVPLSLLG